MTFGSLFAGIGGMDLGLERAGMRCVWQVEIDEFCRKVLAKHWPDVRRWDDVRTFPPEPIHEWECDVIVGGFPCQDISKAGHVQSERQGLSGERSGLWTQFLRVIRTIRPTFALVENVPRLLVSGMGRLLGDLAEVGFNAEWHCVPAYSVGACHIRDRVFILAYSQCQPLWSTGCGTAIGTSSGLQRETRQWGWLWTHPWAMGPSSRVEAHWHDHSWESEPALGRVVDGFPGQMDRLRGLGNAVVPQVAEWIGRRIMEARRCT